MNGCLWCSWCRVYWVYWVCLEVKSSTNCTLWSQMYNYTTLPHRYWLLISDGPSSLPSAPADVTKPVEGGHRNHRRSAAPAGPAGTSQTHELSLLHTQLYTLSVTHVHMLSSGDTEAALWFSWFNHDICKTDFLHKSTTLNLYQRGAHKLFLSYSVWKKQNKD